MIYLYALGAANGLLLSLLLFFRSKSGGANHVIALMCLLFSVNFLSSFIYLDQSVNVFSFLIGWTYFFPAAYGGLLFLYCKKLLDQSQLNLKDSIHLLPLAFCYALNIDILLAPSEQKLAYIMDLPPLVPSFYISQFILYAQALMYGALSVYLLVNYKKSFKNQFSNVEKDISKWLAILITLSLGIWLLKLIASVFDMVDWLSHIGSALIVVLIYLIAFTQWLRPQIFIAQGVNDISTEATLLSPFTSVNENHKQNTTDQKRSLDQVTHALLANELIEIVISKKLYLQENLSLTKYQLIQIFLSIISRKH